MTRTHPRIYREEPYNLAAVDPERLRWYWMGKSPRVRAAVEEYLIKYGTPDQITYREATEKHGITEPAMLLHIKRLIKEGLIPGPYTHINREAMKRRPGHE